MSPIRYFISFILLFCFNALDAQITAEKKKLTALRIHDEVKIDGVMDEEAWSHAAIANKFIVNEPNPGIASHFDSEIKILYDDEAIYIGALLKDAHPDSILKQLTQRDELGNSDFFAVTFDCYRDGINGLEFVVTAAGVQQDTKYSQNQQDVNWNAVWWSKIGFTDDGWAVEMKIPYAALRFPDKPEQIWHLNFQRSIRRVREQSYWNEIKPQVAGFFNQCGLLQGIKDIKAPLRLFFYPYISTYIQQDESQGTKWEHLINGGMDLKYGINDAFTLDMTLIPDFGQVQSDNQVLNLSPFEVQFNENRQFFTEGTELFNKANLFYSRRIGGTPFNYGNVYDDLSDSEEVISNPRESRLLNATKVSGRNENGLGIGVFNAITATSEATIRDTETGNERTVITDPFTNYNVFVLDQNLWPNSYVSLINTNVWRAGQAYEANVTGTEFKLATKDNSWNINGVGSVSQKYFSDSTALGHNFTTNIEKTSGQFNFGIGQNFESHTYDRNDLGFLFNNNENSFYGFAAYNIFEPFGKFNRYRLNADVYYSRLDQPDVFNNFGVYVENFFMTRKFHAFNLWMNAQPLLSYDYFEPRETGRFYTFPINYNWGGWISSDYRKKFALDAGVNYRWFDEFARDRFNWNIAPRFRVSDKLLQIVQFNVSNFDQDIGWVNTTDDGIILGSRDLDSYQTIWTTSYVFNELMSLSFRMRHYWTRVKYVDYHLLGNEGELLETTYSGLEEDGSSSHNVNFNAFNIDLVYRWVFSPGSEIRVVWKNSILGSDTQLQYDYRDNIRETFSYDQLNSFSLRVLYFLDYRSLKKKK
jgi:hypothetical protein